MQNGFGNMFPNNHPPRSNHIPIPNHGRLGHLGHHRHNYFHHSGTPSLSIESCPETPLMDHIQQPLFCSTPKVPFSSSPKVDVLASPKTHLHRNNHHHHSIQELIRHFSKKMHWRSESNGRRNSCSENNGSGDIGGDQFRSRSKSLDCNMKKPVYRDCEETYRIYETILKEGTLKLLFIPNVSLE